MRTIIVLIAQWVFHTCIFVYGQNCHLSLKVRLLDEHTERSINGADTTKVLRLKKTTRHIDEVTVTADAKDVDIRSSVTIDKQMRNESQGKNLAGILDEVAGLSTLKTGANNGKPVINGLYGNRLILLNHGVRHESQQWGTDHAPEIDPFSAEEITIIKNADAVRYGPDALGGIIKLSPAVIDPDRKAKSSNTVVFNSNGRGILTNSRLEGTVGKLAYRVGITAGKRGNLMSAMYYLGNTGSEELNANVFATYKTGNNTFSLHASRFGNTLGVFEGAHIGSKEDIMARIANGRPFEEYDFSYQINAPRQYVVHELAKLEYGRQLDLNRRVEVQFSTQRNHRREFDLRRVMENDIPMADIVLQTQQLEVVYTDTKFTAGVLGSLQINNNIPGTGATPIIPNFENHGFGSFISIKVPIKNFAMETGIRYDYKFFDAAGYQYDYGNVNPDGSTSQFLMTDQKHFHNLSGIVGVNYRINPSFTWKSSWGLAWRAPSANELYSDGIHHGTGTYEVGNRDLKSEKGLKWLNSLLVQRGMLSGNIDVFGQIIDNYIYSQPVPDSTRQTIRGTFPLFQYKQDRALFYGLDVSINMDINRSWRYGMSVSMVEARNLTKDEFLPNIPAARLQHALTYRLLPNRSSSYVKIKHRFQTSQRRYELHSDFAPPPPSYHLFDAILASSVRLRGRQSAEIQLAVENIFNEAYKDYMDRFRYYAHALGRNISVKINFTF